jgi:hypothetical protein
MAVRKSMAQFSHAGNLLEENRRHNFPNAKQSANNYIGISNIP